MNISKEASVFNLTESIKEFLSPHNVQSTIDENKFENGKSDNSDLLKWIWNDFLVSTFNRQDIMNNKNINRDGEIIDKGTGIYAYFTTNENDLKVGFTKLINGTNVKVQSLTRENKILNDDLSHVHIMGIKIQVIPSNDRLYRCIREEHLHERINNSTLKDYVPKMYFGCSMIINNNTIRLTFIEHLSGYINLRSYFNNINYKNKTCINEAMMENIKKLLILFWNNGVSDNDFAAQNIMIDILNLRDIKLIDFGLLSLISLNLYCDKQWDMSWGKLADIYNAYYEDVNVEESNKGNNVNIPKIIDILNLFYHFNERII